MHLLRTVFKIARPVGQFSSRRPSQKGRHDWVCNSRRAKFDEGSFIQRFSLRMAFLPTSLTDLQDPRRLSAQVLGERWKANRQSRFRVLELQRSSRTQQFNRLRGTHVLDYKAVARPTGQDRVNIAAL